MLFHTIWILNVILIRLSSKASTADIFLTLSPFSVLIVHYFLTQTHYSPLPKNDLKYRGPFRIQNVLVIIIFILTLNDTSLLSPVLKNGYYVDTFFPLLTVVFLIENILMISFVVTVLLQYEVFPDFYYQFNNRRITTNIIILASGGMIVFLVVWFIRSLTVLDNSNSIFWLQYTLMEC